MNFIPLKENSTTAINKALEKVYSDVLNKISTVSVAPATVIDVPKTSIPTIVEVGVGSSSATPQGQTLPSPVISTMKNFEVPYAIQAGNLNYVSPGTGTFTYNPPLNKIWYLVTIFSGLYDDVKINNVSVLDAARTDEFTANILYYDTILSSSDTLTTSGYAGLFFWYYELDADSAIRPVPSVLIKSTTTYTVPTGTTLVIRRITGAPATTAIMVNNSNFFYLGTYQYWRDICLIFSAGTVIKTADAGNTYFWGYLIQN